MTALQDWLSSSPVDPKNLKALIRDALRGLGADVADEAETVQVDLPLLRRGVERC